MTRCYVALTMTLCGAVSLSCGRSADRESPTEQSIRQEALSAAAGDKRLVRINDYEIDVAEDPPAVPPELDVSDEAPGDGLVTVPLPDLAGAGGDRLEPPSGDPGGGRLKWIVQLVHPAEREDRGAIADLGVVLGDYLPDQAFVATMDRPTAERLSQHPIVRGITRLKPAYKIHSGLKDASGRVAGTEVVRVRVRVDEPRNLPSVLAAVRRRNGAILSVGRDVAVVAVSDSTIARLARLESVVWIEKAVEPRLLNDVSSWTIQTFRQGDRKIWDRGLHGEGQIVGIGDTGLDGDMCFFRDPSGVPVGPQHRKVVGYAALADDHDGDVGHGTHVAGSVAGDQSPITGATTAGGMAPAARVFMSDLTPGDQSVVYVPSDLADLFAAPYLLGARLHTNSWGAATNYYDGLAWSADRFMWEHKDFMALFANGNSGPALSTVGTPAVAKNAISVGATQNGDAGEDLASFSSHGPAFDGRTKPTVTAPGVGIVSADSDGIVGSLNCGTVGYNGTSMATPTVAGAAALVRQYFAEGYWPFGSASPARAFSPSAALVKATLVNSGHSMSGAYVDGPIPSTGQGWGRIELARTLHFAGDPSFLEIVDMTAGLETGAAWTGSFMSSGDLPLKVTLVWSDHPASPGAATALVNDLDLVVVGPDGVEYLGNVFAGGVSVSGGAPDRVDVEEQVLLLGQRGRFMVRVQGYNVPTGPQPFALVVTGGVGVTSRGFLALDKGKYGGADTVRVELSDLDLDVDALTPDQAAVLVQAGADEELLTLGETGLATGVFAGTLATAAAPATPGDGVLQLFDGALITATYLDADDGTGLPATDGVTAVADLTAPHISGVAVGTIEQDGATVSWTTDEATDGTVEFGESPALGAAQSVTWLSTAHSVQLHGLKEATTYLYAVTSRDEAGNGARDDDAGALHRFTTAQLPPAVSAYSSNSTETYASETVIMGTAVDPSGVASVTVNGAPATYRPSDGYFEREFALELGENTFTVVAADGLGNVSTVVVTVTRLALPDLVIQSLVTPPTGGLGEVIHLEQTLCNVGAGPAPGSGVMAWFLTVDGTVSPADDIGFPVAVRYGDVIAAGECVPIAVDIRTPMDTSTLGSAYSVGAYVDVQDEIWESDEANNGTLGGRIEILGPDLRVRSVSSLASVGTEVSFPVPVLVDNAGPGASSGFGVAVYLSDDPVVTGGDLLLASGRIGFLYAGDSAPLSFTATIPSSVPAGTYYIGAVADGGNAVQEVDEGNNALTGNQVEVVAPDLFLTAVTGPASASAGEPFAVSSTVAAREGLGGVGPFVVGVYLSTDAVIDGSDLRIGTAAAGPLAAGASSTVVATVTLPTSVAPGTYHLGAIADDGSKVAESDETNNALPGGTVALQGADLVMEAVSGPVAAAPGETVSVSSTVAASASGTAASEFFVGIFLSTDEVITAEDRLLGYRRVPGLAPGARSTESISFRLPWDVATGTYHLGAIADDFPLYACDAETDTCWWVNDAVKETDSTNNVVTGSVLNVGSRPDLTVTAVTAPASAAPGDAVDVVSTVTNAGNLAAASFTVGIYLSVDDLITAADTLLGTRDVTSLAAGEVSTASTAVVLPAGLAPGTYRLGAIADSAGVVAEWSEANNALAAAATLSVQPPGAPDLVVSAVVGPAGATPGASFDVESTVTNVGNLAAASFTVGIYLSTDDAITTADLRLGSHTIASLDAGASSTATAAAVLPADLAPGTYRLGAIVDADGAVAERDEANNALAAAATLSVQPPPTLDLALTAVSGPATTTAGKMISVSTTVENGGPADFPEFTIAIYVSTDQVITTADVLLTTRRMARLAPGATRTDQTRFEIPNGTVGVYYLGAIVDPANEIPELDEGNDARAGNRVNIKPAK